VKNRLEARLAELAAQRLTITYGALAKDLAIPGPGAIAQLTSALEALMEADAAQGRPLRAALVVGRLNGDQPAAGFFLKAAELGLLADQSPEDFLQNQREGLWGLTD
jgi:hypothetical protein